MADGRRREDTAGLDAADPARPATPPPAAAAEPWPAGGPGAVARELRKPLTAIKGAAAVVLGSADRIAPTEIHAYFRIVDEAADRLAGLASDLGDLGDIAAGRLALAPAPTALSAIAEKARRAFLGRRDGREVAVDAPDALPPALADAARIEQVLAVLLDAVARHAAAGAAIRIGVEVARGRLAVGVAAVPRERAPGRPRRGRPADGGGDADPADPGIGLAACAGVVEAHGGRLRVLGPKAGPAGFAFALPIADAALAPPAPPAPGQAERILVAGGGAGDVAAALAGAGYRPLVVPNTHDLARRARAENPALVLFAAVPDGAGDVDAGARTVSGLAPLAVPLILVARDDRGEAVARALDAGAADYVVSPFSAAELGARVRAALRRHGAPARHVLGELRIDHGLRRVAVRDAPVPLTATEYDLLHALALAGGAVVTHRALLREVWGESVHADARLVRAFVKQVRRKLGDVGGDPAWIVNVRGIGYRLASPDAGGDAS